MNWMSSYGLWGLVVVNQVSMSWEEQAEVRWTKADNETKPNNFFFGF